MSLNLQELSEIIGITSVVTTAATTVIVFRMVNSLRQSLCDKIEKMAIRLGIVEHEHNQEDSK